jgi:hypothetical protein
MPRAIHATVSRFWGLALPACERQAEAAASTIAKQPRPSAEIPPTVINEPEDQTVLEDTMIGSLPFPTNDLQRPIVQDDGDALKFAADLRPAVAVMRTCVPLKF